MNIKARNQLIITAILLHILSCAYLYVVDQRVIDNHYIKWDSEFGHTLLIPAIICIAYAWVLLAVVILKKAQVLENDGHWEAKAVHYLDKHAGLDI